jgi:hypothetical protein
MQKEFSAATGQSVPTRFTSCIRFEHSEPENIKTAKGNDEKDHPWPFSSRKSKNAVFDFLHFQPLIAIENAGPSSARLGKRIKSDVAYH